MNLPNKITLTRIFLTPFMILFFLLPIEHGIGVFIALFIFILASLSDMLDGKIARKYNLITNFGKFMDQIADKFIATTAIILILFCNILPTWVACLIIIIISCRDTLVSGIRQISASKGIVIPADIFGKCKSLFLDTSSMVLMLYIGLTRAGVTVELLLNIIYYLGITLLLVGTILTIVSGINYTIKAIPCLKEKSENK